MSTFESIHIKGFRRLVDVKLAMRPLTVLIGANGCGKTSFLDAWRLLAKSGEGNLSDAITSLGGLSEILTRPRASAPRADSLSFEIQFASGEVGISESTTALTPHLYSLRIVPEGIGFRIEEGSSEEGFRQPALLINAGEAQSELVGQAMPRRRRRRVSGGRVIRNALSSIIFARPFELAQVRLPQSLRPATLPGEQGETLFSCLFSLRETDRDRFEVIEDTLRAAFPDFERLEFPPVAAGMLALAWKDRQFTQPIYMNQFSEGTLRFLWLTALLLSRDLPAVTLIDEPEISLHPQLLMLLVDLMREASMRTQLIVATQSDQLVRFLKPEEVFVADVEDGATKFTWGSDLDLDHWLKDFTLDQLWTMGVLGGRS